MCTSTVTAAIVPSGVGPLSSTLVWVPGARRTAPPVASPTIRPEASSTVARSATLCGWAAVERSRTSTTSRRAASSRSATPSGGTRTPGSPVWVTAT